MSRVDIALILAILLFLVIGAIKIWCRQKLSYNIALTILIVYFLGLLWFTLLSRMPTSESVIRLIPHFQKQLFRIRYKQDGAISSFQIGPLYEETKLNVLLFIPLGFLLPGIANKLNCLWKVLLAGSVLSLTIETTQYVFHLGWLDTDDILMNILGTVCGYMMYMLLCCLFRFKARKEEKNNRDLDN